MKKEKKRSTPPEAGDHQLGRRTLSKMGPAARDALAEDKDLVGRELEREFRSDEARTLKMAI